ncbi:MAG: tetratricopeptide repeat protein [Saprospiraceae bacterium]|nr:tetratricopeptide repeat protein [Saprospiraceae bacterium]
MSTDRLAQLKDMLKESPQDSFLLFAIAKEYEGRGDPEKAREYYTTLLEKDPAYLGTYYHLGKLYERQGDPERALELYDQGMERSRRAGDQHNLSELAAARLNLAED